MQLDDAETNARRAVERGLREYADLRRNRYGTLQLRELVTKDLLMLALRGPSSATGLIDRSFLAWESSSEETHMGTMMQLIATDLATGAIDLGDVLVEREGDLWVVEVKSQTNTTTGRFRPELVRILYRRVQAARRHRPARRRQVRAAIGVLRGPSGDQPLKYRARNTSDREYDEFEFRMLVGRDFWQWLTGRPGIHALVGDLEPLREDINAARATALERVHTDLTAWLNQNDAGNDSDSVLRLVEEQRWP